MRSHRWFSRGGMRFRGRMTLKLYLNLLSHRFRWRRSGERWARGKKSRRLRGSLLSELWLRSTFCRHFASWCRCHGSQEKSLWTEGRGLMESRVSRNWMTLAAFDKKMINIAKAYKNELELALIEHQPSGKPRQRVVKRSVMTDARQDSARRLVESVILDAGNRSEWQMLGNICTDGA